MIRTPTSYIISWSIHRLLTSHRWTMIRQLPPELEKVAREELNENPKRLQDDLQHLKEWIAKQPHLKARTDDQWLVAILRGCKFSLERVKKKLDLYYTLRTTAPDITLRMKPTDPKFLDFLRLGTCVILPKVDNLQPRVVLLRPGRYDPAVNHIADVMCVLYYLIQILVVEDDTATVLGTKIVTDYEGVNMNHLAQANPTFMRKMIAVSQESMPLRLKGSHHVNVPSGIEVVFTLVKTLLSQKANERLKMHKTNEDLLKYIPKEIVPKEYGGTAGSVAELSEYWAQKVFEYKTWMEYEETLGTDESKRVGDAKTAADMFGVGVQGSFRKLDIDYDKSIKEFKGQGIRVDKMTIRPLPASLQKKAEKEVNEDPKRLAADLVALREWLSKQPHLESVQPSDQWLVAFLRGSKFSLERSKEKFDMYYTLKALVPEFFSNRDPLDERIQGILKLGVFLPVKNVKDADSSRVCIVRVGVFDPSNYHLADLIKVAFMVTEILMLEDDNFTIIGEDVIVDMQGVGVNILSQWTPALAKKVITSFEKALPVRVRSNHMLNTPTGFEAAYTVFKAFLGEKLKKRIQVHNQKYTSMHKSIPKSVLPKEYGGDDGTVQELTDHWREKVESYRDWFLKEENSRSDESKRPEMPKTTSALFGVEGSFRKLEVD
ncbi:uncharacterized protein LOC126367214 [Pectinophora gossypiella]|uniref:uncharacterized protein LOC126367214 n=1 Tax=Pectinophora gossypiella TaxID=13191 RepID=UPI00214ED124|nr:uncharacterized protein LOC126367214 [Pectinophora gossypiella]